MKILSKEELKNTNGGLRDGGGSGGGGGLTCNSGATCRVVTIINGTTYDETGTCASSVSGSVVACYCNVQQADTVLTSNNGMSRCWS